MRKRQSHRPVIGSRPRQLPTSGIDRVVFCFCYGDKFNGDNHEEALSYARFCVLYLKGMKLPPYDTKENE